MWTQKGEHVFVKLFVARESYAVFGYTQMDVERISELPGGTKNYENSLQLT